MAPAAQNPLLSAQKSSDSGLQVALHPLVLLTISDYITRHTLRQQEGPIIGALIGQQNGREITIENAFDCKLEVGEGSTGHEVLLHKEWFEERLQQMKDVFKTPPLDLVGWYTIMPTSGPRNIHLPIHRQILETYNESALLLAFHPEEIQSGTSGGKLPLTIYESVYEADTGSTSPGEDKEMTDASTGDALTEQDKLSLRFKELPYTVETGEAEMIAVDGVARTGGNATAVDSTVKKSVPKSPGGLKGPSKNHKSKMEQNVLSQSDEELIASLTAKANAIKMLQSRINLIAVYLQNLPPSYTDDSVPEGVEPDSKSYSPVNHSVLRMIQALLNRLSLIIPADSIAFEREMLAEKNDVSLVSLLNGLTESIQSIRNTGKKYSAIEQGKASKMKKDGGGTHPNMWESGGGNSVAGDLMG